MPRRETQFLSDNYYHFYNRGNNRQAVFFEEANYLFFLRGIKKYLASSTKLIAYCLMPTHYHMLGRVVSSKEVTEQPSEGLDTANKASNASGRISNAMQKFLISYTKAINNRFTRVGALFQGQFKGKPVKDYSHLLNLCIYIHANPVKDGLVASPEDWPYSNYLEWIGERDGTLFDSAFIRENFGSGAEYKALVKDYLKTRYLPEDVRKYLQSLED